MTRSTLFVLLALGALSGCAGYGHHAAMHDDMQMNSGQMMGGNGKMMGDGMMAAQSSGMMGDGAMMMDPAMFHQGVLAAQGGRTLYRFDKDSAGSGSSACNDACAAKWPPFMAPPAGQARGDFGIVSRSDHSRQWSYKGWPLYFWSGDQKAGDMLGDNINGIWHVIKP